MKSFGAIATIVGFIVDSITLLSILLNFNMKFTTSIFANAWLGFVIAVLAAISYAGYLQLFWESNFEKQNFQPRFSSFLVYDLLFGFRRPFLLLPIIILVALVIWLILIEPFILIPTLVLIVLIFSLFFAMFLWLAIRNKPSFPPTTKAKIENQWSMIEKRIAKDLSRLTGRAFGIQAENLKDLAIILDVDTNDMGYALIKFAMLHPELVEYDFNYNTLRTRIIGF